MRFATFLFLFSLLGTSAFAQNVNSNKAGDESRVLIEAAKPYDSIVAKIESLGGVVRHQYKHIDAIAATVPTDKLNEISGFKESGIVVEDKIITQGEPRTHERPGFGDVPDTYELDGSNVETQDLSVAPDGYFPTEVEMTRARDFWGATGHFGEGVVIGIMDSGIAPVLSLGDRIVGGDNFVAGTSLDDGLPAVGFGNGSHGTQVATAAGADIGFCFPPTHSWALAIKRYLPEAVTPGGCSSGADLIPMVGQAPSAEFYSLKIFNASGSTSNSIILAAFDRAIEMKEQYDAGVSEVNLQVINGSFGGGTLYAAEDPFFARMVDEVNDAGIVTVISAGNYGPSGITGGDPGTSRSALTVGATSPADYEKILREIQYSSLFGPGAGELYRANDLHVTADFSSRGPTADGRIDPDITAPGFAIFGQNANSAGGISLASGTSFSAPIVAGAAALLLSEFPDATPEQIRAALMVGADPNVLEDDSDRFDQGHGFLDVLGAYESFGAPLPTDEGRENKNVKVNIQALGLDIITAPHASRSTGWLLPGEREEYFVETKATDASVTVEVSVTAELPPDEQNPLFGDAAYVNIHSAKTAKIGSNGDYLVSAYVGGTATFVIGPEDLEEGLMRVTISGDVTNAGRVQADVRITTEKEGLAKRKPINGKVSEDETNVHTLFVEPGTTELRLVLDWDSDWSQWPTNDLDLIPLDPSGNVVSFDAATSDAPERLTIENPAPGEWTLLVDGYTIWEKQEKYQILVYTEGTTGPSAGKGPKAAVTATATPEVFALNAAYPNPFAARATVPYAVPEASDVRVVLYDVLGREVAVLVDGFVDAAYHEAPLDASALPNGTYLVRMTTDAGFTQTQRVSVVR